MLNKEEKRINAQVKKVFNVVRKDADKSIAHFKSDPNDMQTEELWDAMKYIREVLEMSHYRPLFGDAEYLSVREINYYAVNLKNISACLANFYKNMSL